MPAELLGNWKTKHCSLSSRLCESWWWEIFLILKWLLSVFLVTSPIYVGYFFIVEAYWGVASVLSLCCHQSCIHTLLIGLNKMADILQTALQNASFWLRIIEFSFWFHWNLFLRVNLTMIQHGFSCLYGTKPLPEPVLRKLQLWCHIVSLSYNELMHCIQVNCWYM